MNSDKYISFLESLKNASNEKLIDAVIEGFNLCHTPMPLLEAIIDIKGTLDAIRRNVLKMVKEQGLEGRVSNEEIERVTKQQFVENVVKSLKSQKSHAVLDIYEQVKSYDASLGKQLKIAYEKATGKPIDARMSSKDVKSADDLLNFALTNTPQATEPLVMDAVNKMLTEQYGSRKPTKQDYKLTEYFIKNGLIGKMARAGANVRARKYMSAWRIKQHNNGKLISQELLELGIVDETGAVKRKLGRDYF